MNFRTQNPGLRTRAGFTIIELMVVVALIGILIGGVFKLMGVVGQEQKRATTITRMQKLENALSGFYAKYGSYPPVQLHGSPDPMANENTDGTVGSAHALDLADANSESAINATRAAGCQPVAFEFPPLNTSDIEMYIAVQFDLSVPNVAASGAASTSADWPATRLFKFGVVSFLVPRLDAMGNYRENGERMDSAFTGTKQWTRYNPQSIANTEDAKRVAKRQADECASWLPNLAGLIFGGKTLLGINTSEGGEYPKFTAELEDNDRPVWSARHRTRGYQITGIRYPLTVMTIRDGWNREFFYYSAPPYQSYRLWSAGPNGWTFPAEYPMALLTTAKEKAAVTEWVKDDVVRVSR
jgi:prepilin-type N-terminal cleavage/methylation domain-containing protein